MPTYFAEIVNGTVSRVIVAHSTYVRDLPGRWVETWMDGGSKKNYAGRGYTLDDTRGAFVAPKPRPNATFDEQTCRWNISPPEMR